MSDSANRKLTPIEIVAGLVFALVAVAVLAYFKIGVTDNPSDTAPKQDESFIRTAEAADFSAITNIPSLEAALRAFRPQMKDSLDGNVNLGTASLAIWASKNLQWSDIQKQPATKWATVRKDSEPVMGYRICVSGTIVEITADKTVGPNIKLYYGGMGDDDGKVYRFYAARSTGDLVDGSRAKFCGLVTGAVTFPNALGGSTSAVQLVGMFDLPENRK